MQHVVSPSTGSGRPRRERRAAAVERRRADVHQRPHRLVEHLHGGGARRGLSLLGTGGWHARQLHRAICMILVRSVKHTETRCWHVRIQQADVACPTCCPGAASAEAGCGVCGARMDVWQPLLPAPAERRHPCRLQVDCTCPSTAQAPSWVKLPQTPHACTRPGVKTVGDRLA
jgi:hypothetical protein